MQAPTYGQTGPGGGQRISQPIRIVDFSKGLNLVATPQQLQANESSDCVNVDLPKRGGIVRRRALDTASATAPTGAFDGLIRYEKSTGDSELLFGLRSGGATLFRTLGSPLADLHTVAAHPLRSAVANDKCYVVAGHANNAFRYDGSTVVTLGGSYADSPDSLPGGNMPRAKCIAIWQNSCWVANLYEGAVSYPSAIRWSWPDSPEDWPSWAKELVDSGHDSDEITALMPHNERLLVFKRNSVHAIVGQGPNQFRLIPLSQTVGAISQEAVVKTDTDVFFFDWPNGLMRLGPSGVPEPAFEPLMPILRDGRVPAAAKSGISVSWVDGRIWASVPWAASPHGSNRNGRTFVYDPQTQGWTAYDFGVGHVECITPSSEAVYWVGAASHPSEASHQRLAKVEQPGTLDYGSYAILGRFRTAWIDAGDEIQQKRFRKVGVLVGGLAPTTVGIYTDYSTTVGRTSIIPGGTSASGATWGSVTWGAFSWTEDTSGAQPLRISQGRKAGTARAMAIEVGNASAGDWEVAAINLRFIAKRRRD